MFGKSNSGGGLLLLDPVVVLSYRIIRSGEVHSSLTLLPLLLPKPSPITSLHAET